MTFKEYKYLVLSDLYRYTGQFKRGLFLKSFLIGEGFRFSFWMRTCCFVSQKRALKYTLYPFVRLIFRRSRIKYGISISHRTSIGPGLFIGHIGGIVVNENSVIGKNCNLSHGVTIGKITIGKRKGTPSLGDDVYIGPGAKIIGGIKIGNKVAIGANSVVTKEVEDGAVVAGIPAVFINESSSENYINRIDYDKYLDS